MRCIDGHLRVLLGAKCTGFDVNYFQIPRPPAGLPVRLLHKVCADRESDPESPESEEGMCWGRKPITNWAPADDWVSIIWPSSWSNFAPSRVREKGHTTSSGGAANMTSFRLFILVFALICSVLAANETGDNKCECSKFDLWFCACWIICYLKF
jgi:hypothetical protein